MSFWDNVKKFAQPYSDEEYEDDYEDDLEGFEEPQESTTRRRRPSPFASADTQQEEYAAPAAAPQSTSTTSGAFSGQVLNMSTGNKQEDVEKAISQNTTNGGNVSGKKGGVGVTVSLVNAILREIAESPAN